MSQEKPGLSNDELKPYRSERFFIHGPIFGSDPGNCLGVSQAEKVTAWLNAEYERNCHTQSAPNAKLISWAKDVVRFLNEECICSVVPGYETAGTEESKRLDKACEVWDKKLVGLSGRFVDFMDEFAQSAPQGKREWKPDDVVGEINTDDHAFGGCGCGCVPRNIDVKLNNLSPEAQALLRGQSERDMTPAKVCPDCEGYGVLGHARDGRLISCETCGGHEDSIGTGTIKAIFVNSDKAEAERKEGKL